MGLDMYLERCERKAWGFKDVNIEEAEENNPELYEELKPFIVERGKYYTWRSIFSEMGYWRKANAIHKWFVDNVQNGVDDCGTYEVTKEQLEDLLDTCKEVITESLIVNGWVKNGEIFANGIWCPIFEEGNVIVNPKVAHELLPTQSGFFFGSTDYDEWYMEDLKDTVEILTQTLEETNFETQMIVYSSSW